MLVETLKKMESVALERATSKPMKYERMKAGEYHRQGDVCIRWIPSIPSGCRKVETESQLAPGSTQGSRHCIKSTHLKHLTMYRRDNQDALQGPLIQARESFEVMHPEHGHVILPAGCYAVTYQRQYAEELRAVKD